MIQLSCYLDTRAKEDKYTVKYMIFSWLVSGNKPQILKINY